MRSFIDVPADSHFPIQNLPYGVFQRSDADAPSIGVAIGDQIVDLRILQEHKLLNGNFFSTNTLNRFMAAGRPVWTETRQRLTKLLSADELLQGHERIWREVYSYRSIRKRFRPRSRPLPIVIGANLAYRFYAHNLSRFYTCRGGLI